MRVLGGTYACHTIGFQMPIETRDSVRIEGPGLAIADVVSVARLCTPVELDPSIRPRLEEIRSYIERKVEASTAAEAKRRESGAAREDPRTLKEDAIYGVTTGFGALKGTFLANKEDAALLQENIVISHSAGVGQPLDDATVRAIMLIRASTLAAGYSGVRWELIDRLVRMLNRGVLPVIPEQGSVGASGDLAPLAHLALGVVGLGPVHYEGREYPRLGALPLDGAISPEFKLSYKEGLALINGLAVTAALAALNVARARELLEWANIIGSMTAEAVLAAPRAFDEIVFKIYRHEGAKAVAERVRGMTAGSELINSSADVHDPYSIRCIPQVHGAVADTLQFAESSVARHLRSVDDDPVFFTEAEIEEFPAPADGWRKRLHYEHGHFHGAPLGYAMDFLGIVMSDLASISERRIAMLVDKNHNRGTRFEAQEAEVPAFLTYSPNHTTSGVMLAQYVAASLVSENKVLSHPASVDTIPTSADSEDHVSMSTTAARKARSIIANVESVLAIELLCAGLALAYRVGDLRTQAEMGRPPRLGDGTRKVYDLLKSRLDDFSGFRQRDCILYDQVEKVKQLLRSEPGV